MKKGFTTLLSMTLALSAPLGMLQTAAAPVLAAESDTSELPDVSDMRETGTWGEAKYYLLDDGTLYFGPGKTTSTPPKMYLSRYVKKIVSHPDLDTSALTSLYGMFENYSLLEDISGLANWKVFNVETMYGLFAGTKITNVDALSNWEVNELTSINSMFYNCTQLRDLSGLRSWAPSLRDLNGAFQGCTSLTSLDGLDGWSLYLGGAQEFSGTFAGCSSLTDVSALSNWRVQGSTNFCQTFNGCDLQNLEAFKNWNVAKCSGFDSMFANNTRLTDISGVANWDLSGASGAGRMFAGCTSLSDISPLNSWTLPEGNFSCSVDEMFKDTAVKEADLSSWDTSSLWFTDTTGLFHSPLTKIKLSSSYMSNTTNKKTKLIEADTTDSYGSTWTNANLAGPYSAEELFENWSDDLAGWWGRAKTVTFTQDPSDAASPVSKEVALAASVETALPLDWQEFDLSSSHKELIGWKKAGSDEVLSAYTAALTENAPVLTAVYRTLEASTVYSFDANGGQGEMAPVTASTTAQTPAVAPNCTFAQDGYAFTGWNSKADGSGETILPGEKLPVTEEANAVLYAQWKKLASHSIAFDANGGSGNMETLSWIGEDTKTVPNSAFVREHYSFTGWNTKADGSGTTYATGAAIGGGDTDTNLTLYAQWLKDPEHSIVFDANGGEGSMSALSWYGEEGIDLPACTFMRERYTFAGWNTMPDGSGTSYADCAAIPGSSSDSTLSLYAQWNLQLDYTLLDQAIEKAESIKDKDFKAGDQQALEQALALAKTARAEADDQSEINQAADRLGSLLLSLRLDPAKNALPQ